MIRFLLLALCLAVAGPVQAQQSAFGDLQVCSLCHSRLSLPSYAVDEANPRLHPRARRASRVRQSPVGPAELWPGSMMAHAARDPYWKAKVRYETGENPALGAVIEDTCLRCHAPMQQYEYRPTGKKMALDDLNSIGKQGVGCTVCHQITPDGLGTKESFEANFVINENRFTYGPHAGPFDRPMTNMSGYTPVEGKQILESSMCGTCHTVITPTVDAGGNVVGEFVEQAPYLEWLLSDYPATGESCQSCHMPVLQDAAGRPTPMYIAHNPSGRPFPPTSPRVPFGQHFLTGGNAPMLRLLSELFPSEANLLGDNLERTREFLANALTLNAEGAITSGELQVNVKVTNNTGHKLPTGFPSRRIWLHFVVTDDSGAPLFESGAWDPRTGEIRGLHGLEPHRQEITDPAQVMIYETEMHDTDHNSTVTLLRAAGYLKDNRLLPRGFNPQKPLPEGIELASVMPAGVEGDERFLPGSHEVSYKVPVPPDQNGFRVHVEVLYQNVMPAHVAALDANHSSDEATFVDLYSRNSAPALMATEEILVRKK